LRTIESVLFFYRFRVAREFSEGERFKLIEDENERTVIGPLWLVQKLGKSLKQSAFV